MSLIMLYTLRGKKKGAAPPLNTMTGGPPQRPSPPTNIGMFK